MSKAFTKYKCIVNLNFKRKKYIGDWDREWYLGREIS